MFCCQLALAVVVTALVSAQDFRGRIQGRVVDASQAVVPSATVTLVNTSTGIRIMRQTNELGLYRFDYVDPGPYTVTIEAGGFSKFLQENLDVQAQADVTVNAVLKTGDVLETVTVEASPIGVEFNSANVGLTVDTKLAEEIPRFDRNPFKLSLLNPAVVETRRQEMNPFHSLAANSLELGGGTNQKNDLVIDGSPAGVGNKTGYTPNTDAIQQVTCNRTAWMRDPATAPGASSA